MTIFLTHLYDPIKRCRRGIWDEIDVIKRRNYGGWLIKGTFLDGVQTPNRSLDYSPPSNSNFGVYLVVRALGNDNCTRADCAKFTNLW
jgi:hypothetical protein